MPFHTTSTGAISPCGAETRSCPLAPADEHYRTVREASRALALDALDNQADYQLSVPAGWGEVVRSQVNAGLSPTPASPVSSLSVSDFENFRRSSANTATPVSDDWRETIARNAQLNGDAYEDAHADTSLTSGIYDPTEDEPLPEEDGWAFEPF